MICMVLFVVSPIQNSLLVLGMKNYGASAWKVIQQNLLPTKAPKQVNSHTIHANFLHCVLFLILHCAHLTKFLLLLSPAMVTYSSVYE